MSTFTPGPWVWKFNEESKQVRLQGSKPPGFYIMGFVRYGMTGAAPTFRVDGIMCRADECGKVILGQEHNAKWNKTIEHPDAKLIAASPTMAEKLLKIKEITLNASLTNEQAVQQIHDLCNFALTEAGLA